MRPPVMQQQTQSVSARVKGAKKNPRVEGNTEKTDISQTGGGLSSQQLVIRKTSWTRHWKTVWRKSSSRTEATFQWSETASFGVVEGPKSFSGFSKIWLSMWTHLCDASTTNNQQQNARRFVPWQPFRVFAVQLIFTSHPEAKGSPSRRSSSPVVLWRSGRFEQRETTHEEQLPDEKQRVDHRFWQLRSFLYFLCIYSPHA